MFILSRVAFFPVQHNQTQSYLSFRPEQVVPELWTCPLSAPLVDDAEMGVCIKASDLKLNLMAIIML